MRSLLQQQARCDSSVTCAEKRDRQSTCACNCECWLGIFGPAIRIERTTCWLRSPVLPERREVGGPDRDGTGDLMNAMQQAHEVTHPGVLPSRERGWADLGRSRMLP